jgi:UDP-glucose 4-epimerase
MRIVVVGASGNIGTSLLRGLRGSGASVTGVSRRAPADAVQRELGAEHWHEADIAVDPLVELLRGADAVVHLAWRIQPSRDTVELWQTNVHGTRRVLDAVVEAGIGSLIYASSVGAYARGPQDGSRVDESWPTAGIAASTYSRHKALVERLLDRLEREHPSVRVVRVRPALVFKREAATGIRRLFAGPFLPGTVLGALPVAPSVTGLRFQCVHAEDVASAFAAAVLGDAAGAFNVAGEPVLAGGTPAELLSARPLAISPALARRAVATAWHARLTSISPDWVDLGLGAPLMDTRRASDVLGWEPAHGARETLAELLRGLQRGDDGPTPPLAAESSGPFRWRELATGLGRLDDAARRRKPTP